MRTAVIVCGSCFEFLASVMAKIASINRVVAKNWSQISEKVSRPPIGVVALLRIKEGNVANIPIHINVIE